MGTYYGNKEMKLILGIFIAGLLLSIFVLYGGGEFNKSECVNDAYKRFTATTDNTMNTAGIPDKNLYYEEANKAYARDLASCEALSNF